METSSEYTDIDDDDDMAPDHHSDDGGSEFNEEPGTIVMTCMASPHDLLVVCIPGRHGDGSHEHRQRQPIRCTDRPDSRNGAVSEVSITICIRILHTALSFNERLQLLKSEQEDRMFPDEVDTPLDTPARTRFARYPCCSVMYVL